MNLSDTTLAALLLTGLALVPARAQENVVQNFDGSAPLTTPVFKVQDKWEIRWNAPGTIAVTLLGTDGTILAGSSGFAKGSLYQPKGGSYYLQINGSASNGTPWHVSVVEIGAAPAADNPLNYAPITTVPPPGTTNIVANAPAPASSTPPESSTSNPAPPAANPNPATLPEDQAHAVVIIKGDYAEGTGFLAQTPKGPAIITNLHVISVNPNPKVFTTTGEQITVTGIFGATDRDLALLTIKDNHYSYFNLADDIKDTVQTGDAVVTPGNSEGGEVVLNTKGDVLGIGPDRVEISNPIYHGNSGGPVIHSADGKVIAVVTQAMKVTISNDVDKASHDNKNSAISGSMRYFGLRVDTVPQWEPLDWNRFLSETTFLKNFHQQSRCLDSFLNGTRYEHAGLTNPDPEAGAPNSRYYLHNDHIREDVDNFRQLTGDADGSQKLDAQRELLMDLETIADSDMDSVQNPANFYSFDQIRTKEEIAYRKALKTELDSIGNKISDLGH
jgi:hypothetical protein